MRIVYLGSGAFGIASLQWLHRSNHEIPLVITQPARAAGRGRQTIATPIAVLTRDQLKLPCIEAADVNTPDIIERISDCKADLLLVVAFGQKIGPELLNLPNCRTINLHGSLLPKYRGAAPINWAIINGEKETGLTIIELNEVWDGGASWGQSITTIQSGETAKELHDRLASMGPDLLDEVLKKISRGDSKPQTQDDIAATRAPKLKKSDGAIQWSKTAQQICNQILGLWSWPGAYCQLQKSGTNQTERVTIARSEIVSPPHPTDTQGVSVAQPGTLLEDMTVACGSGRLQLLELKPESSRLMSFADFVNGRYLKTGDRFLDG